MKEYDKEVSLVIPVYNEEESLGELYDWIHRVFSSNKINGEVIFIDDGSTDSSWSIISELHKAHDNVIGLKFNRNYGKSAALDTGFQKARGEVVVTMDADMQDSPDEVPELMRMILEEEYHLVSGWKRRRHDPLTKTVPSKFFNAVTRVFSGIKLHDFNCGLKAYKNEVVKSVALYGEMHRYIPLLAKWNGFKNIGEKVVEHRARKYGVTKFGIERYIKGFLDLLSVTFVTRFKKNPMHFFGAFGSLSFLSGFGITAYLIADKIIKLSNDQPVRDIVDQPLFFLSLVALVIGVQLFLAGFLAEMIIHTQAHNRDYLISEQLDVK